ncbi:MAG: GNAT family N-acetyltransferase [Planctomycetota bacterium]
MTDRRDAAVWDSGETATAVEEAVPQTYREIRAAIPPGGEIVGDTPLDECFYRLPQRAGIGYRLARDLDVEAYSERVRRGWYRVGEFLFRPACPACVRCRPIRVDARRFRPTKSQRRCLRRNGRAGVRVEVGRPIVNETRIRIARAHAAAKLDDYGFLAGFGGATTDLDGVDLIEGLFDAAGRHEFTREFRYYRGRNLIGFAYCDVVPPAFVGLSFYYDPEWRSLGPGTFSMLREIMAAAEAGCEFYYPGWWNAEYGPLAYKTRFRPYELLTGFPDDHVEPRWFTPEECLKPEP